MQEYKKDNVKYGTYTNYEKVYELYIKKKFGKKKEISVMSKEQQKVFLEYAVDSPYYNLYVVALGTGLRAGELRALEWKDIDFTKRMPKSLLDQVTQDM